MEKPTKTIYKDGTQEWRLPNGDFHREDGPAIIKTNGERVWYWNGKIHRDGGPAVILVTLSRQWYQHGKRHREDGPAIIDWLNYGIYYLNDVKLDINSVAVKIIQEKERRNGKTS
jgi:hypothetical protein